MSDVEDSGYSAADDHFVDKNESADDRPETSVNTNAESVDDLRRRKVDRLIAECKGCGSNSLDLSRCGIQELPDNVLELRHLEYIYLEGNDISRLPENFFGSFPHLKWLDLRLNRLINIPSFYLGDLTQLRTLLLEDNRLSSLPLELGLVRSLDGLNIRNNPLAFPPEEVMEKGIKTILKFLQTMLDAKNSGNALPDMKELIRDSCADSECSDDEHDRCKHRISASNSLRLVKQISRGETVEDESSPGPRSLANGRSADSAGRKYRKGHRPSKKRGLRRVLKTQSEKYLDPDGEKPITDDQVYSEFLEERRLLKEKKLNIKEDGIIQGHKDKEIVKNWREEAKNLQQNKVMEKRMKGKLEYDEPATKAPYGISSDDLRVKTNEERLALDPNKKEHVNKPMSPEEILQQEKAKRQKENLLVSKIKEHTRSMLERRLHPLENPQMEMEAALRDFEIAEKLQQEIEWRRKELEYGFPTRAADVVNNIQTVKKLSDGKKY